MFEIGMNVGLELGSYLVDVANTLLSVIFG